MGTNMRMVDSYIRKNLAARGSFELRSYSSILRFTCSMRV